MPKSMGKKRPLLLPAEPPEPGKPYDIRERAFLFSLQILDACGRLPSTTEGIVVRQQLARCGTSIGANLEEADGTISKADRRKSLVISRKEALETRYWLRIAAHRWPAAANFQPHIQEAAEILRILSRLIQLLS
ncbi:MAG TPA: four helix bundle protein [Planctomycetota bacterium]